MSLRVNVENYGVELHQPDREKRVFLSVSAWENLIACQKQITLALKGKEKYSFKIDEIKDIRAHTNVYKENVYVHIRTWWQDRPTKNGVALSPNDWNIVRSYMTPSAEMALGLEVMKRLVQKKARQCEGCSEGWSSQFDHTCLMDGEVLPEEFILTLAKAAFKKALVLQTPHDTYKRIKLFHLKEIENEVEEDERDR